MVVILLISTKLTTLGLLKIKLIWSNVYDVIISFHDVTNKILSFESNHVADVVKWPKFERSSLNEGSYHNLNFTSIWPEKTISWGMLFVQVQ